MGFLVTWCVLLTCAGEAVLHHSCSFGGLSVTGEGELQQTAKPQPPPLHSPLLALLITAVFVGELLQLRRTDTDRKSPALTLARLYVNRWSVFLTVTMSEVQPLNPRQWLASSRQRAWLRGLLLLDMKWGVCLELSFTWTHRQVTGKPTDSHTLFSVTDKCRTINKKMKSKTQMRKRRWWNEIWSDRWENVCDGKMHH